MSDCVLNGHCTFYSLVLLAAKRQRQEKLTYFVVRDAQSDLKSLRGLPTIHGRYTKTTTTTTKATIHKLQYFHVERGSNPKFRFTLQF